jgi:hypothetical protein
MPAITLTPIAWRHDLSREARPHNQQKTEGRPGMAANRRTLRPGRARRQYAIVPDLVTQAQYIWDPDTDQWYGPFATRWDAELTLVRARESPDRCPQSPT